MKRRGTLRSEKINFKKSRNVIGHNIARGEKKKREIDINLAVRAYGGGGGGTALTLYFSLEVRHICQT